MIPAQWARSPTSLLSRVIITVASWRSTLTGTASSKYESAEMRLNHLSYFPRLVNPYVQPILYVRKPGDDHEQVFNFPDDDPFFSEARTLLFRWLDFMKTPVMSGF